jgi:hypothetical protein
MAAILRAQIPPPSISTLDPEPPPLARARGAGGEGGAR